MKNRIVGKLFLGIGLAAALPFAGGCVQEARSSAQAATIPTNSVSTNRASAEAETPNVAITAEAAGTNDLADLPEIDIAEAPYKPLPAERVVPPGVRTNGPLAEILRMADAGVEEGVLLAFVTNSTTVFGLDADEVIYLNDIGVPSSVVTAMLQTDQALKEAGVAPSEAVATAPAVAPETSAPAPDPSQIAPQSPETASTAAPPAPSSDTAPQAAPAPQAGVTYQTFYDTLSPYGNWVYIEGYGRVWQPTVVVVNPDWSPYVHAGRWMYTDAGWYWMSDYSWGWAPFHYGRWFRHYRLGWCWYPDVVWGPSWVTWRYNAGYCGWAPLPPGAWYRPGFGLTWWGGHVGVGFSFGLGYSSFTFVNWGHFHGHRHLHHHAVPHHRRHSIYRDTVVATRIEGNRHHAANRGLPVQRVAAATGQPIRPVAIRESTLAGRTRGERLGSDGRSIAVYRPKLTDGNRTPGTRPGRELGATAQPGTRPQSIAASRFPGRSPGANTTTSERKSWERPVPATRSIENRRTPTPTATAANPRPDGASQATTPDRTSPIGSRGTTSSTLAGRTAPNRTQVENRAAQSAFANRSIVRNTPATGTANSQTATAPNVAQRAPQAAAAPRVQDNRQTPTTPAAGPTTTWQRGTVNSQSAGRVAPSTATAQPRTYTGNTAVNRDWRAQAGGTTSQRGASPAASAPSAPSAPSVQPRPATPTYQRPQVATPTVPRSAPTANAFPRRESVNPGAPATIAPQRQQPMPTYNRAPDVPRYTAPAPVQVPRSAPSVPSQPRIPNYSAPSAPARTYSAPQAPTRTYSAPSAPSYSAPSARSSAPAASAPSAPSRGGGWNRGGSDQSRGGR